MTAAGTAAVERRADSEVEAVEAATVAARATTNVLVEVAMAMAAATGLSLASAGALAVVHIAHDLQLSKRRGDRLSWRARIWT